MKSRDLDILLVEDDPADAELTIYSLRQGGVATHIQLVRDGAEALDFVFCRGAFADRGMDQIPRVVLLDLKSPRVSGHDVLAALKADPRTSSIPVVVLTSSNLDGDIIECYRRGVNSYLQKPMELQKFQDTVRHFGVYWLEVNEPPPYPMQPAAGGSS